ncbi:hypothetical protein RHK62_04690 [Thermosynechococcus sp. HY213]|nr:hypothetical protein [Thermosynechococcus sp. HY213]MDR7921479.1 hypothetical protein [Thermosynechococcus sp. HY213]
MGWYHHPEKNRGFLSMQQVAPFIPPWAKWLNGIFLVCLFDLSL